MRGFRSQERNSVEVIVEALKNLLPRPLRGWLCVRRQQLRRKWLMVDRVTDFSRLRRLKPYRPSLGVFRGQCIDRHYIEGFLDANRGDICGEVLEVENSIYTYQYGGERVTRCDVIDLDERNPARTITADLTDCTAIADNSYDCVVLPQTLMLIYDFDSAIRTIHRVLRPGGVVLATVSGIAPLCPPEMIGSGAEYWRFTRHSARRMFAKYFGEENTEVAGHGNVLAVVAFLHGLVVEEFTKEELDQDDPDYEVTVTVRARKVSLGAAD
jgi:SAM-dependent methyltransferase